MPRNDGVLLSCWRQTARKPGSIQERKNTMQKWYDWLEEMKRKYERRKMEELYQQRVSQMIKSAEDSAGLLHKITKPAAWRGGVQILQ